MLKKLVLFVTEKRCFTDKGLSSDVHVQASHVQTSLQISMSMWADYETVAIGVCYTDQK